MLPSAGNVRITELRIIRHASWKMNGLEVVLGRRRTGLMAPQLGMLESSIAVRLVKGG